MTSSLRAALRRGRARCTRRRFSRHPAARLPPRKHRHLRMVCCHGDGTARDVSRNSPAAVTARTAREAAHAANTHDGAHTDERRTHRETTQVEMAKLAIAPAAPAAPRAGGGRPPRAAAERLGVDATYPAFLPQGGAGGTGPMPGDDPMGVMPWESRPLDGRGHPSQLDSRSWRPTARPSTRLWYSEAQRRRLCGVGPYVLGMSDATPRPSTRRRPRRPAHLLPGVTALARHASLTAGRGHAAATASRCAIPRRGGVAVLPHRHAIAATTKRRGQRLREPSKGRGVGHGPDLPSQNVGGDRAVRRIRQKEVVEQGVERRLRRL